MARRIVHQLVDDLDGTVLEIGDGETVLFSLEGTAYEIDLSRVNAASLHEAFAPFIAAARPVSAGRAPRTASSASTAAGARGRTRRRSGQQDYGPIREWAKVNGYRLSERGRVPAAVLEAYAAAH